MKLDRNHSEDVYMILKMHEIIKRYELLVEHLLNPENSNEEAKIRLVLIDSGGNIAKASRILGCSRATILHRMKKYGIELEQV